MSTERVWKKPGSSESEGVQFIRPSKLTETDVGNVIAEGVYLESMPNHYDETKLDFKFESSDGRTIIINGAGNLQYRMKPVNPGQEVQVTYEGRQEIMSGKMKGRAAHNFTVMIGE